MIFHDDVPNLTGIPIEPCPFCGAKAVLRSSAGWYWNPTYTVSCTNDDEWHKHSCRGVACPNQFDPEDPVEAIQRWNKRDWPLPPTATAVLRDCYGNWYDVTGTLVETID